MTVIISHIIIYVKGNKAIFYDKNISGDNMKNEKEKNSNVPSQIPANNVASQPETVYELINKYGTYEIQPICDSDNDFPKIAQGLPKEEKRKVTDKD